MWQKEADRQDLALPDILMKESALKEGKIYK
jgi:hypothetical protein